MKPIKAIIALCEGKTDVAFLKLLLQTDGYKDYIKIVSQIPQPLGLGGNQTGESYFINKLKTYKYDSSKLRDRPLLPFILRRTHGNSDTFILLYDMNGMNRTSNYREIIDDFSELGNPFKVSTPKIDAAITFIYDLDDKTTTDRL